MRLLRGLLRALRWTLAALGGVWSVLMMLLMAGSLALSVAMAVIPAVFAAVSDAVETVTGIRSLHSRQIAREARLTDDVARAERRAASEAAERRAASGRADNLARELADSRAVQSRMARELADSLVTYRGTRMAARQAVKDTASRVSRRTALAATRNVGSMAGEALPAVGVGVIAAATAWELRDACQMMREMRELDAAFNPDDPISDDEVCGTKVPSREELWSMVRASPAAAWDKARGLYGSLPEGTLSRAYARSIDWMGSAWDSVLGADSAPDATTADTDAPPAPEAADPPPSSAVDAGAAAPDAADPPSVWNSATWFGGK